MRTSKLPLVIATLTLAVLGSFISRVQTVSAATAAPGITVSPARLNYSLSKDAAQQTQPVTVTNGYDSPITLSAQFQGIDENAGLLVPTSTLDPSFASTLRVSDTTITLAARETKTIQVQASNPVSLSPGGHYATLVLTQVGTSGKQLSLNAAISLSLFVVKVEGAQLKLTATSIDTDGWLFKAPTSARITFKNDGNVHAVPRAVVSVLSDKYDTIAKGIANQQSLPLLPGGTLTSEVSISHISTTWKPQKLLVWTAYRADGVTEQTFVRRSVWYVPPIYPMVGVLLIAGVGLVLRSRIKRLYIALRRRISTLRPSPQKDGMNDTSTESAHDAHVSPDNRPAEVAVVTKQAATPIIEPLSPPPSKPAKVATKSKAKASTKKSTKAATKKPSSKSIPINDEPASIKPSKLTLASLEQRTTRITPKPKKVTPSPKKAAAKPVKKNTKSTAAKKPKTFKK